jgi:hypothetical protein
VARQNGRPSRLVSKRPRMAAKVPPMQVEDRNLDFSLFDSDATAMDLPPIPRFKRKKPICTDLRAASPKPPSHTLNGASPSERGSPFRRGECESGQGASMQGIVDYRHFFSNLPTSPASPSPDLGGQTLTHPRRRNKDADVCSYEARSPEPEPLLSKTSGRPPRRVRSKDYGTGDAISRESSNGASLSKEPIPRRRVQPKRGRGLPLCRHRVVQVYSRLLARAGPNLKRSSRMVEVEKRLHKGYSDMPALSSEHSLILKRAPTKRELFSVARASSSGRGKQQSWRVSSKRRVPSIKVIPSVFPVGECSV